MGSLESAAPPPPPLTDAATAFVQAIRARLAHFIHFEIVDLRSRSWASVTFRGARHEIDFKLEGEGAQAAAGRLLEDLDARDFRLRGHLLVNLSLVSQALRPGFARIRLEALTVEER
jgi:hypothetical protein